MPHTVPTGLWLPLVTPFRDGEVDRESWVRLVRHYSALPVQGLIVAGTTGESLTLDHAELEMLVRLAADNTQLPVWLGLAGSDTRRMVARLDAIRHWPVGGLLVACPYYTRPSQAGMVAHFTALAQASPWPVLLYNIPYRTGVNLGNDAVLELAALPNVVGIKDCCADPAQSFDLTRRRPQGFSVLTGEDGLLLHALTHGAQGGILASAHVETGAFGALLAAVAANDLAAARAIWSWLADVPRLLFAEPNPGAIKHWLWRDGLIASPELRLPMTGISDGLAARLDAWRASR